MLNEKLDIYNTYIEAFISVTKTLAGFPIQVKKRVPSNMKIAKQITIKSKGGFRSVLRCSLEQGFENAILHHMSQGLPIETEIKDLYLGEYVNIVCGHVVTYVNNSIGHSSRLSVPEVEKESRQTDPANWDKNKVIYFESEYGNMKLEISYELSP